MNKLSFSDNLGKLIRRRRQELDLSLRELAQKTNLTAGFLSQIERGESKPSLDTLIRIAGALNSSVENFFINPFDKVDHVDKDIGFSITPSQNSNSESKISIDLLCRDFSHKMEFFRCSMKAGTYADILPLPEHVEEIIYLLQGTMKIVLNSGERILQAGHYIYIVGSSFLRQEVLSSEDAVWIQIITPPVTHPHINRGLTDEGKSI